MYEPLLCVFERAQTCIHQASHGCPSIFHFLFFSSLYSYRRYILFLILDGGGGGGGGCLSISVNGYILLLCIHIQTYSQHIRHSFAHSLHSMFTLKLFSNSFTQHTICMHSSSCRFAIVTFSRMYYFDCNNGLNSKNTQKQEA